MAIQRDLTFEEHCAHVLGYKFVETNEISEESEIKKIMERHVYSKQGVNIINAYPANCDCRLQVGGKCQTSSCPVRKRNFACRPECGTACLNNPWYRNGFEVDRSMELRYLGDEIGYGIFAKKDIRPFSFLGEYAGEIRFLNNLPMKRRNYAMLLFENLVVYPGTCGSAMNIVNHSCFPNAYCVKYYDGLQVKLVFKSDRSTIKAGQQITIMYEWRFSKKEQVPRCLCQSKQCKGFIGKYLDNNVYRCPRKPHGDHKKTKAMHTVTEPTKYTPTSSTTNNPPKDKTEHKKTHLQGNRHESAQETEYIHSAEDSSVTRTPTVSSPAQGYSNPIIPVQTFSNLNTRDRNEVDNQFQSANFTDGRVRERVFHEHFQHRFTNPVYSILVEDNRLTTRMGRVMACFENDNGHQFYVVRDAAGRERYIPRFLTFTYYEDALHAMTTTYTQEDLNQIHQYYTIAPTQHRAAGLNEIMPFNYIELWRLGRIPPVRLQQRNIEGLPSVGLSHFVLTPIPEHELAEIDFPPVASHEMPELVEQPSTSLTASANLCRPELVSIPVPEGDLNDSDDSDNITDDDRELDDDRQNEPEELNDMDKCAYVEEHPYDCSQRVTLPNVLNQVQNEVLFNRVINTSIEGVSIYAQSRKPQKHPMTHTEITKIVRKFITYYYQLAHPDQRRFLTVNHYRLGCEVHVPGSLHLNWCSLCNEPYSFKHKTDRRNHFESHHSMAAEKYKCPNTACEFNCTLPSQFRTHYQQCKAGDKKFVDVFREHLPGWIIDALVDVIRCREMGNRPLQIIIPGLPKFTNIKSTTGTTPNYGKERIKMNTNTRRPVDVNVEMVPAKFTIQTQYTEIKSWKDVKGKDANMREQGEATTNTSREARKRVRSPEPTERSMDSISSRGSKSHVQKRTTEKTQIAGPSTSRPRRTKSQSRPKLVVNPDNEDSNNDQNSSDQEEGSSPPTRYQKRK